MRRFGEKLLVLAGYQMPTGVFLIDVVFSCVQSENSVYEKHPFDLLKL